MAANGTSAQPDVNDAAIASALGTQPTQQTPAAAPDVNDAAIASALGQNPQTTQQQQTPSVGARVWQAAKGMVNSAGQTMTDMVNPPQTHTEVGISVVGGLPALNAFRAAKGIVDAAKHMATAAATEYPQAVQDFNKAVDDYHSKDFSGMAADAASTAADVAGVVNPVIAGPANEVRQYAQDTKPGGNLAGDVTRGAIGAGAALAAPELMAEEAPEVAGAEGAEAAAANEAPAKPTPATPTNAADTVAATNAAKAPIAPGVEAQTEAPTVESLQPQIQQNLRDTVNAVANNEGLQEVPADTSVRDLGKSLGDQFYARSKDIFAKVQQVTGVDLNNLADKISTLNDKIADAVDNPEKAGQLEQQKIGFENQAEAAFNKAKDAGIDPEQARTDWKKFNASYDFGKQIRAATDGRAGIGSGEVVDPNKLAPRLQKLADSNSPTQPGRLQQFMGDENTNNLLNGMESGRGAIRDFQPTTATGQKALQKILADNTGKTLASTVKQSLGFSPKTNYVGAFQDFNKLSAEDVAARFPGQDAATVRTFLQKQAAWQVTKMAAKGIGLTTIAHTLGVPIPFLHAIVE